MSFDQEFPPLPSQVGRPKLSAFAIFNKERSRRRAEIRKIKESLQKEQKTDVVVVDPKQQRYDRILRMPSNIDWTSKGKRFPQNLHICIQCAKPYRTLVSMMSMIFSDRYLTKHIISFVIPSGISDTPINAIVLHACKKGKKPHHICEDCHSSNYARIWQCERCTKGNRRHSTYRRCEAYNPFETIVNGKQAKASFRCKTCFKYHHRLS